VPITAGDPAQNPAKGFAPFGFQDFVSHSLPRKVRLTDITDGTSQTMLMSEVIMAMNDEDYDIRGDMLNDDNPCTQFMTINTPNSGRDSSTVLQRHDVPLEPAVPTSARRQHAEPEGGAEPAHRGRQCPFRRWVNTFRPQ